MERIGGNRYQEALDSLQKIIEVLSEAFEAADTDRETIEAETGAALQAALDSRDGQILNVEKRIEELKVQAAQADASVKRLAQDTSAAYGKGDKAKAQVIEKQLYEAQQRRESLNEQAQLMANTKTATVIPVELVDAAKVKYQAYSQYRNQHRNGNAILSRSIENALESLGVLSKKAAQRNSFLSGRSSRMTDFGLTLVEIVENNEGPLDVSGHHCGGTDDAKLRFCMYGVEAPGLEDTPLIKQRKADSTN